ncbi:hypothetical protein G9A89_019343 [Geosiphon pyriformis]|nr:hypothetical protein G9A89_019343 [Geosiphon pyriformis]
MGEMGIVQLLYSEKSRSVQAMGDKRDNFSKISPLIKRWDVFKNKSDRDISRETVDDKPNSKSFIEGEEEDQPLCKIVNSKSRKKKRRSRVKSAKLYNVIQMVVEEKEEEEDIPLKEIFNQKKQKLNQGNPKKISGISTKNRTHILKDEDQPLSKRVKQKRGKISIEESPLKSNVESVIGTTYVSSLQSLNEMLKIKKMSLIEGNVGMEHSISVNNLLRNTVEDGKPILNFNEEPKVSSSMTSTIQIVEDANQDEDQPLYELLKEKRKRHQTEDSAEELEKVSRNSRTIYHVKKRRHWSKEDEDKLITGVGEYGKNQMEKIAREYFGNQRTIKSLGAHWYEMEHPECANKKREVTAKGNRKERNDRYWSQEDIYKLRTVAKEFKNQWKTISKKYFAKTRSPKSLCSKWYRLQNPVEARPWTEEQDKRLEKLVMKYGVERWKKMVNLFPGRNSDQLYNRWDVFCQEKARPWPEEERKKLLSLVEVYGKDRKRISQEISRTPKRIAIFYEKLESQIGWPLVKLFGSHNSKYKVIYSIRSN